MFVGVRKIEVKRSRGKLRVTGIGQTPRGTKILGVSVALESKSTSDPGFKSEMEIAVKAIVAEPPLPL